MRTNFLGPPVCYSQKISAAAPPSRRPLDADTRTFLLRTTIKRVQTTNRAAYLDLRSVTLHKTNSEKMIDVTVKLSFSGSEPDSDVVLYKIDLENGSVAIFSQKRGPVPFTEPRKNILIYNLEWLIGIRKNFKQISSEHTAIHQESLTICFDDKAAKHRKSQQIYNKVVEFIDWLRQIKH